MTKSYDVVVVGGGVVGLAAAWRARRRGLSVLVVERGRVGDGASGVAAGMLAPVTEADFGEDRAIALNLAGLERWPAFAAELSERSGVDTGYRRSGALVVAADRDDAEVLRRVAGLQRSLGLEASWLTGREARRLEPGLSPRVPGALEAPAEGYVDPPGVVAGLRAALLAEGGELREQTTVERLELADGGAHLEGMVLGDGASVRAEHVVLAAGAWSGGLAGLPPGEAPPIRPVKGQILSLRAGDRSLPAERLIRTLRCYVVSRTDGRVVIGATTEERGFDVRVTAEGIYRLLEAAREVLPDVDELEFVSARAGLRPGTPDNAPVVGRGEVDGLVWATGHGRNGVLLAPITAEALAALVCGEEPPEELASYGPDRFPARAVGAGRP
ncbi:MAG: Glycine oxidase ThiO [uncultured Solirubrobacterales bacterium]|uniref:glycine oxidase n=1 Tax=uncultured Solirubrobacterales bacterium TaxID=768556 RepID=A0A6J4SZP6_9ACTN|nr:MAG: Glycine oxidase ThiO [uncultured Solirubrobacterales bacterium]